MSKPVTIFLLDGMLKRRCRAVWVLAGALAVAPVFAGPTSGSVLIYSNFGSGGSYNTGQGWVIGKVGTLYGNWVDGEAFTTTTGLRFADAQLGMFSNGGTTATVYLQSDNAGSPGSILDTLVEQSSIGWSASLVTFTCSICPLLSASTQYWIAAAQGDKSTSWAWNSINDNSGFEANSDGSVTGPWTFQTDQVRGVFEVDGTPVPEPGTLALLGIGLAGLGAMLRRTPARRGAGGHSR